MRARQLVNGLALTGALVTLVGVLFAANSALAEEPQVIDSKSVSIDEASKDAIAEAAAANTAAAADAAEAIRDETLRELDIELNDHKLVLVADSRQRRL